VKDKYSANFLLV